MTPSEPRIDALEALYAAEQRNAPPDLEALQGRAADIVEGVWSQREQLDAAIGTVARGWRVERMPVIDRTLIRIALWELFNTALPVAVVLSEAVKLAKTYSTDRSGAFVNGVLSSLVKALPGPAEG